MSDIFDLDTSGQRTLADEAASNLLQPGQDHPSFWHGVPQAIGMGVMRGGVRAAQAVGMAGGGLLSQLESDGAGAPGLAPGTLTDPYFSALDKFISSAIDYWTPGANEVGTAGRVLGGLSEMTLPLMAGGGNPSLLIGSAAMGTGHDLVQQGVDANTATGVAVTQAAATAIGFRIPFLGSNLITRMASGAAGNLAVNAGSAEISHAILQAAGYDAQAKSFDPLDVEARIVDILSGAVFGTVAHLGTPSMRDAVATAANAKHFQYDTAPGEPADITASVAHQKAMEAAVRDTLAGKPVDLSGTGIDQANFNPRDRLPAFTEMPEELHGVDEALKPEPTHAEQIATAELSDSARNQLSQHYEQASQAKPAFDAAVREISQETGTPHEPLLPGLKGVKRATEKVMADYGGDVSQLKDVVRGTIVADSQLQIQSALKGIKQHFGEPISLRDALSPESTPVSSDGYRDVKANVLVNGHVAEVQINVPEMLAAKKRAHPLYKEHRAISAKAELENRDVTPKENARQLELEAQQRKIYAAAWNSFLTRERNTASETKVPLWAKDVVENRRPSGTSQARQTPSDVREQGTPSTSANSVPGGNFAGSDMASTSSRSIPETGPNSSDPVIRAAFQALTAHDFQIPTGETDASGNPVYRSAREVMAESEADVAKAKNDAKGFDALVGCILMKGDG